MSTDAFTDDSDEENEQNPGNDSSIFIDEFDGYGAPKKSQNKKSFGLLRNSTPVAPLHVMSKSTPVDPLHLYRSQERGS